MSDTQPNPAEPPPSAPEFAYPDPPPPDTPAPTSELAPMLDVHPAHHAASTWKDFFIHIATIVLGLLIAVSLEQLVEYIHHRRELAETRVALATERKINIVRFSVETEEFHRFVPILQDNLAIFVYLRQHPGKPLPPNLGTLRWNMMSVAMLDGAWIAAQHNGVVDYMPQSEARNNSQLYGRLNGLTQAIHNARTAFSECIRFRIVDPDPAHLSPEQLDQEIDLVSRALIAYRTMANVMTNTHAIFPDFTPAPSVLEYRAITHTPTQTADDLRDSEATAREVDTFRNYERSLDQNEGVE
jgi:hypothetical protein